jgi:hypothetical protein
VSTNSTTWAWLHFVIQHGFGPGMCLGYSLCLSTAVTRGRMAGQVFSMTPMFMFGLILQGNLGPNYLLEQLRFVFGHVTFPAVQLHTA